METFENWRALLKYILSDANERQRIANVMDIHPMTLIRWANKKANPRGQVLQVLCGALPEYRAQLAALIVQEYPNFVLEGKLQPTEKVEIHSEFYSQVLRAYTTSLPHLRTHTVLTLILQQIVNQFDAQIGDVLVFVAQCVPPVAGKKVRSLIRTFGRGTGLWQGVVERKLEYMGVESLAGIALSLRYPQIARLPQDVELYFPDTRVRCAVALPLLLGDSAVGSFCLLSANADWLSDAYMEVMQQYAYLLQLAYEPVDRFPLSSIELAVMPPLEQQQPLLDEYGSCLRNAMLDAARNRRSLTQLEAEQHVLRDLEEQLIALSLSDTTS